MRVIVNILLISYKFLEQIRSMCIMYVRKGKINATIVKESLKVLGLITYYIIHNLLLLLLN